MEKNFYYILSGSIFIFSILFYLFYSETIIIYWNRGGYNTQKIDLMDKKKCALYYWANNNWVKEDVDVIWGTNKIKSITNLIESWLNLLEEENISDKKIGLQSISLDHSNSLYINFAQPIFKKNLSTYAKLLWVQGLLKTLQANTQIKTVQFLLRHRPLSDRHLDFSKPWPVTGYLN